MKQMSKTLFGIALSALLISTAGAQDTNTPPPEYKEYSRGSLTRNYFDLCRTADRLGIIVYSPNGDFRESFPKKQLRVQDGAVYAGETMILDSANVYVRDTSLSLEKISGATVVNIFDSICVRFTTRTDSAPDFSKVRRGHRIGGSRDISVPAADFVRGMIFTTTGKIDVYGEVNKDVISVFGDIHAGEGAKLRGDAVSLFGKVDIEPEASVYGHVLSGESGHSRRHRLTVRQKDFEVYPHFIYNRVDGATPLLGARFVDTDSSLPFLGLEIGYAFASERLRWKASAEQTILRKPALTIGGAYGRWLESDDNRIVGEAENTFFALIARDDFKDYYETDFGEIFVRTRPLPKLTGELAFRYDRSNWLEAHRHLWSLFGGDRLFSPNWSTVPPLTEVKPVPGRRILYRERGIREIDTSTNSVIRFTVEYDTRFHESPFDSSAWDLMGQSEWSISGFDSDWDYARYLLSARRYQVVTKYTTLLLSGFYGNSSGYLPMYKRFFLGGLRTLEGYDHKEYMGTRFWQTSAEYRLRFKNASVAFSLLWDVGQIANDTKFGEAEVKHSIGAAVYLGNSFRVSLSRRLDRSTDADPKIYVRLEHGFWRLTSGR